jgi:hypothetical protein
VTSSGISFLENPSRVSEVEKMADTVTELDDLISLPPPPPTPPLKKECSLKDTLNCVFEVKISRNTFRIEMDMIPLNAHLLLFSVTM